MYNYILKKILSLFNYKTNKNGTEHLNTRYSQLKLDYYLTGLIEII